VGSRAELEDLRHDAEVAIRDLQALAGDLTGIRDSLPKNTSAGSIEALNQAARRANAIAGALAIESRHPHPLITKALLGIGKLVFYAGLTVVIGAGEEVGGNFVDDIQARWTLEDEGDEAGAQEANPDHANGPPDEPAPQSERWASLHVDDEEQAARGGITREDLTRIREVLHEHGFTVGTRSAGVDVFVYVQSLGYEDEVENVFAPSFTIQYPVGREIQGQDAPGLITWTIHKPHRGLMPARPADLDAALRQLDQFLSRVEGSRLPRSYFEEDR